MQIRTPWYHGWNMVAICVLIQAGSMGVAVSCFSFFLQDWSREFRMPVSEIILAMTLFSIGCSIWAPIVGGMVQRLPLKRLFTVGVLGIGVAHLAMGLLTAGWQLLLIYPLLFSAAITFSTAIPSQTLISRWFVKRRGLAFSICAVGLVASGILFPPLVVWLLKGVGWRATWWVFGAGIVLVSMLLILFIMRERPLEEEGRAYIIVDTETKHGEPPSAREVLRRRNFWIVVLVFAPILMSNAATMVNLVPFTTSRGVTLGMAAILMGIYNVAAAVGKLGSGVACDRFGTRKPLMMLAFLAMAGVLGLSMASGFVALAIGCATLGLAQGIWVLLAACMVEEFGQQGFPRAYGIISTFTAVANFSPPLIAWLHEQTGEYTSGMSILAALCLCGLVASTFYRRGEQGAELAYAEKKLSAATLS